MYKVVKVSEYESVGALTNGHSMSGALGVAHNGYVLVVSTVVFEPTPPDALCDAGLFSCASDIIQENRTCRHPEAPW